MLSSGVCGWGRFAAITEQVAMAGFIGLQHLTKCTCMRTALKELIERKLAVMLREIERRVMMLVSPNALDVLPLLPDEPGHGANKHYNYFYLPSMLYTSMLMPRYAQVIPV